MNNGAVWAIARKDLATVLRNRGARLPLLITPVIILVLLPSLLVLGGEVVAAGGTVPVEDLAEGPFDRIASPEFQAQTAGEVPAGARWVVFILEVFMAPLYLLIPLIVATVIAADSFAGERERGTLEALLHTPTTDGELLAAKFLASWVPAVVVAWAGFAVYVLLANLLAWGHLGRISFPSPTWLLLAFWVAPAVSAVGLSLMVIASSRVQSLQAAHQIGSLVVLPIVLLLVVQITGTFLFAPVLVVVLGAALWAVAGLLVAFGASSLRRQALAQRI